MCRGVATIVVYKAMPILLAVNGKDLKLHASIAGYLEVHLMGVERTMYRYDRFSDRFNQAVMIEFMYQRMGLVTTFGLN